jgi:UDP-N-acetylmuramate: L-alanyl-gamma-D-glutamyl-meso-diaminopimelate ligase
MRKLSDFPDAHLRIFERPTVPAPEAIRNVYLIGICGTGMGSMAGLFQQAGYSVSGSDQAAYPPMSTRLAEMGVKVYEGFDTAHLDPAPDLVIVGNACVPTHMEAAYARENGLVQQSFPEALAHFFIRDRQSLVVAGTHGKTTTTGMLVHLFRTAGRDPGFLVGGVMVNGNISYQAGTGSVFIVEGDEYDSAYFDKRPKFMHYRPSHAIITSMEFDHADIYDDMDDYRVAFEHFAASVDPAGTLVLCSDISEVRKLAKITRARPRYYGLTAESDVTAHRIQRVQGGQQFNLVVDGQVQTEIFLPMSGRQNLLNALSVCALSLEVGLTPEEIKAGFASFKGLKRRQEVRGEVSGIIVVDDFAHHPTAVRATIGATRERWPGRRLVAVFEPRSNSSRRKVFESAYATAFGEAELVFINTPPLRHNDRADDFMDVRVVARAVQDQGNFICIKPNPDELLTPLLEAVESGDVVLIMSNGGFGNIHNRLLDALRNENS